MEFSGGFWDLPILDYDAQLVLCQYPFQLLIQVTSGRHLCLSGQTFDGVRLQGFCRKRESAVRWAAITGSAARARSPGNALRCTDLQTNVTNGDDIPDGSLEMNCHSLELSSLWDNYAPLLRNALTHSAFFLPTTVMFAMTEWQLCWLTLNSVMKEHRLLGRKKNTL